MQNVQANAAQERIKNHVFVYNHLHCKRIRNTVEDLELNF